MGVIKGRLTTWLSYLTRACRMKYEVAAWNKIKSEQSETERFILELKCRRVRWKRVAFFFYRSRMKVYFKDLIHLILFSYFSCVSIIGETEQTSLYNAKQANQASVCQNTMKV